MKIKTLTDLKKILEKKETNFILNFDEATLKQKSILIAFLAGFTYKQGNLKKIDKDHYEVKL